MANLFSVFDPTALSGLPLNWTSSILVISLVPISFWTSSRASSYYLSLRKNLNLEFSAILGVLNFPGSLIIPVAVFLFVWANNFLGLAPYIFTSTSHLALTLGVALPLWLGHVVFAWVRTPQSMFAHLVPLGSPAPLSPFMVLIELVSAVIRPLTLSVRLAANMVAGHLLMVLLSSPATSAHFSMTSLIMMALVALAILESAVATIQAYVFSILSVLYVNEVNCPSIAML